MTALDPQPTLADFLLARYKAEAEAWGGATGLVTQPQFAKLARGVLADLAAKRQIVADHDASDVTHPRTVYEDDGEGGERARELPSVPACRQCTRSSDPARVTSFWDTADRVAAPCDTLRLLAQPYRDHSDYRAEWAE